MAEDVPVSQLPPGGGLDGQLKAPPSGIGANAIRWPLLAAKAAAVACQLTRLVVFSTRPESTPGMVIVLPPDWRSYRSMTPVTDGGENVVFASTAKRATNMVLASLGVIEPVSTAVPPVVSAAVRPLHPEAAAHLSGRRGPRRVGQDGSRRAYFVRKIPGITSRIGSGGSYNPVEYSRS